MSHGAAIGCQLRVQSSEGQPGLEVQGGAHSLWVADAGSGLEAQLSCPHECLARASPARLSQSSWVSYMALDSPAAGVFREPTGLCMAFSVSLVLQFIRYKLLWPAGSR